MNKLFLILFCSLLKLTGYCQSTTSFPQQFVGHWKGTLEWTQTGKKETQRVDMELHILPSADTAGQFSWNLVYGKASQDNRPYILKAVDTAAGHWVIDERNGIILDQYWVANRLAGAFTVMNSTIVNSYWLENGKLYLEFVTYQSKPIATTGKGDKEVPLVDSYAVKSYQRAILTKM